MALDTLPVLDRDVERCLGGPGPFVINLHASTAPIGLPTKSPAGNEHARLYKLQRVDDGRIRYRLRLGPFATEDEAEAMLTKVRLEYPGALMVTAAADDLHAIALVRGRATHGDSSANAQAADVVPQSVVETRRYTPPMTAAQVAAAVAPAPVAAAPAAVAPVPVVVAPAPVVAAPVVLVPKRAAASAASDIASMQALMAAIDTGPAAAKVTVRRDVAPAGTPTPSLESTQTLRPLTPLELGEHEAPRWFVVQLALSDAAFDPDALPHLDIFSLYRLYTVIGMDQGRLVHALRLGFFGEEVGARAVANYLASFYDASTVKRVSVAERDRFADQRVEARMDVGASGRHLAIEITDELVVRGRRFSR
jgi:hypothetical protein